MPVKEVGKIIDTILESMTETWAHGESIEVLGFGSFSVREYGSYEGRDPRTGQIVSVKPQKLPYFKVGKNLKEAVNGNLIKRLTKCNGADLSLH